MDWGWISPFNAGAADDTVSREEIIVKSKMLYLDLNETFNINEVQDVQVQLEYSSACDIDFELGPMSKEEMEYYQTL